MDTATRITENPSYTKNAHGVRHGTQASVKGAIRQYRSQDRMHTRLGNCNWSASHVKMVAIDGVEMGRRRGRTSAARLDEFKNEFIAGAIPVLRAPLTAVIGGLGMPNDAQLGTTSRTRWN